MSDGVNVLARTIKFNNENTKKNQIIQEMIIATPPCHQKKINDNIVVIGTIHSTTNHITGLLIRCPLTPRDIRNIASPSKKKKHHQSGDVRKLKCRNITQTTKIAAQNAIPSIPVLIPAQ